MKTKLLFLGFMLLFITSCSVEDSSESSTDEPRVILKKTMERLYKVGKTKDFQDFISDANAKSSTEEEFQQSFEEFLKARDPELVDLYFSLVDILESGVLTEEEFKELAIELKQEIVDNTKSSKDGCNFPNGGVIFEFLAELILCDSDETSSSSN